MRYSIQGLLIALIGLFVFSSCNKSDEIGLDIDPQDSIDANYIDTVQLRTVTVRDDSLSTSNLAQYPLGLINDPILGITESGIAMGLNVPSSGFSFGTAPSVDSAVLVMNYGTQFYGDSLNTTYQVEVHQLSEKFNQTTYYNTRQWALDRLVASSNVNRFRWNDSISINQVVKGAADSVIKVRPQLRIRMDNFASTVLLNAGGANLASNTAFANFIKGLYVTVKPSQPTQAGGVVFLNLNGSNAIASLDVYYKNTNESGTRDTLVSSFSLNGAAASIHHNYEGTAVQNQLDNPGQSYTSVYVQPMGGLQTRVTFPYLQKLKELGNIAINKAELVVYAENGTYDLFKPAPALTIYQTDIAGRRQAIPDQGSSPYFGSRYDTVNRRYIFNISTYLQRILSGQTEAYPLYIISSDNINYLNSQSANITPLATTAIRSVLAGADHPNQRIKLNIYYTRPQR